VRVTLAKQEEAEGPVWVDSGEKPPNWLGSGFERKAVIELNTI